MDVRKKVMCSSFPVSVSWCCPRLGPREFELVMKFTRKFSELGLSGRLVRGNRTRNWLLRMLHVEDFGRLWARHNYARKSPSITEVAN